MKSHSLPAIMKPSFSAVLLMLFICIFVAIALAQAPSDTKPTLSPEEQELLRARKANEEAQAEYYREQTNKLRQPPPVATPPPGKTFWQSVAENPASVVGVIGTILGAIIVAFVSLTALYFNSRNAIKAQQDSQFYEAMKRMGDNDSPTLRASAAGLLALMAQDEWREPSLSKKWPFFKLERSKPYFHTAVDQLMTGHLLENNPVAIESIKNALQQLVPLVPHDLSAITHDLHAANLSLQDQLASLIAEFFVISNCQEPPKAWENEQDEELWEQLKSATGYEAHSLRKLVINSRSFNNRFGNYRLIIDAQTTGDRGQFLSDLYDSLKVVSGHLRANVPLFCTALSKLQPKDAPPPSSLNSFYFERAFLVDGKIEREANLSHIGFMNANFSGMKLYDVNLANASLNSSTLSVLMEGGSLRNAWLMGAEFGGAWIRGVDMTDARLAEAKIPMGLSSNWWQANFYTTNPVPEVDSKLLEHLFEKQGVPTDPTEVHTSVLTYLNTYLESKQAKSEPTQDS
ncbi:MAG: pentapeptide repeat-containing protein [Pyrinomonadaceae bacterium]|nr:pentapeptide repeat-containing protein [Pyrinomonadaceae bacterium]